MRRSLPVLAGLGAALAFLPRAWTGAWGAFLLAFGVLAAPIFADRVPHAMKGLAAGAWIVTAVIVGVTAQGALYELGVTTSAAEARKLGLGPGGLQFALPELRLLGAGAFVAGFLALVFAAFAVMFAFLLSAEGATLPTIGVVVAAARKGEGWAIWIAALGLLCAWTLAQLLARLALFKPATIARATLVSIDARSLTQGVFWPLVLGLIPVFAPVAAMAAWEHGMLGESFVMPVSSRAYTLIRAAFLSLVWLPFGVGFLSYAYNRLEYRPRG